MRDGELHVFVQAFETRHAGVQAETIIELAHRVRLDADLRARPIVGVVGVGHDGVETVVAAGHLENQGFRAQRNVKPS